MPGGEKEEECSILPPPPLWNTKTGAVQEVEEIVDHKWAGTNRRNLKYLVKWRGFNEEEGDWLSVKQLKRQRAGRGVS